MSHKNIICLYGGGRLGNQLLLHSHLIANAFEYKEYDFYNYSIYPFENLLDSAVYKSLGSGKGINLFTDKILRFFEGSRTEGAIGSKTPRLAILQRLITFLPGYCFHNQFAKELGVSGEESIQLTDQSFWSSFSKKSIFLGGFSYRNWVLVRKHYDAILRQLSFKTQFVEAAKEHIKQIKGDKPCVIGLFVRRGDYATWSDGKYFFDIDFFSRIVSELDEQYFSNGSSLLIASDDADALKNWKGKPYLLCSGSAGKGHYVQNIIELSMCDIIVSPPSTFSGMAAFLGNKPLLLLHNKDQIFNKNDIFHNHLFDAHESGKFNDVFV